MHTKRSRMRNDGGGGGARECAQGGREKQVGATLRFKSAKHHTRCTNFPRYSSHSLCRCFSLLSLSPSVLFSSSLALFLITIVSSLSGHDVGVCRCFSFLFMLACYHFLFSPLSLFIPVLTLAVVNVPHCLTNRQI